ncbi:MAG: DUF4339 domain-containing protein [Verrucomicrobia bacterium]|nr:MAG: DUF4339 domain-containing protein [Verrucomicrobiota bacterium]
MYKIIGADGRDYGPVSLEQMRQWLADHRVNAQTRVLASGATDWKNFADIPELAALLQPPPPTAPPTLPAASHFVVPAADQVRVPAIFMIVLSALDIVSSGFGILLSLVPMNLPRFPHQDPDFNRVMEKLNFAFSIPTNAVGLVIAGLCLYGSIQMLRLRTYGLAMATAILMLIPCHGCCCCLNLVAGIWALVVLSRAEVKAAFH